MATSAGRRLTLVRLKAPVTRWQLSFAPLVAGGVFLGGRAGGGQGRYDVTLLGASLGMLLNGSIALAGFHEEDAALWAFVLSPLSAMAGSLLAYYASDRNASTTRIALGPTASLDRSGGSLGIAGLF